MVSDLYVMMCRIFHVITLIRVINLDIRVYIITSLLGFVLNKSFVIQQFKLTMYSYKRLIKAYFFDKDKYQHDI